MSATRLSLLALALVACPKPPTAVAPAAPPEAPAVAPRPSTPPDLADTTPTGIEAAVSYALDRNTDPCTDFYQFACGGWLQSASIPSDRSTWGRGFSTIQDRNQGIVREILEAGSSGDPRLGSYFNACMNEDAVTAAGAAPLKPWLDAIQTVDTADKLMKLLARMPLASPFFDAGVEADFKDPTVNTLFMAQGGLGLPEKGYYTPEDDKGKALLADYEAHIAKMLGFAGYAEADAKAAATKILALETRLAAASLAPEALRDPNALYHRIERKGLQKLTPTLKWDTFFTEIGFPSLTAINVATPGFFPAFDAEVKGKDWATLRAYLAWNLVRSAASDLSPAIDDANFAFFGTKLYGQSAQKPRWKRCVDGTDAALGDLLGQGFVDRAFAGESKKKAQQMISDIEAAFEAALPSLTWMDEGTREAAKGKLHAISNKIGFPDVWERYEGLNIGASHFDNAVALHTWAVHDMLRKVGQPVDKNEWHMTPPTVNAYYNPLNNEIVFPAGIMQPPFFSAGYPDAMNYGAMGMVMGHEVTHGFDDEGRKFSGSGKLETWWKPEAEAAFEGRAACVGKLYEAEEPLPGQKINGELTMGENIADLGGIKLAWNAYQAHKARLTAPEANVAGFTPDQQLFLGYAQSWCSLIKDEAALVRLKTDPHSPAKYRVNLPLSQLPAFAEAFQCAAGTKMAPAERCEVW